MNGCLNCGKELEQILKKREKQFCNSTCRSNYWQKEKRRSEKIKIIDDTKPTEIVKPFEQPKTNFSINTLPETIPEGLNWKEQLEWKRNHKK